MTKHFFWITEGRPAKRRVLPLVLQRVARRVSHRQRAQLIFS